MNIPTLRTPPVYIVPHHTRTFMHIPVLSKHSASPRDPSHVEYVPDLIILTSVPTGPRSLLGLDLWPSGLAYRIHGWKPISK
jgi:hypothetical protein